MDGHLKDIREESVDLCNLPTADANTKEMLTQSIEGVKQGATSLTELYQKLMKLCQQKRDLYIVAVKFHMTIRQVQYTYMYTYMYMYMYTYMYTYMYVYMYTYMYMYVYIIIMLIISPKYCMNLCFMCRINIIIILIIIIIIVIVIIV